MTVWAAADKADRAVVRAAASEDRNECKNGEKQGLTLFASKKNMKVKNDGKAVVFRLGKRDIFAQKRDYRECFVCFSSKMQFILSLLEESGAFKQKFVCYERDKFTIGGFFVGGVDFNAENIVYVFDFSAIPCNFDCVAYCTFYL